MLDSNRLDGKIALITGAGGEIGRATARLMARRGARIVGVDRSEAGLATFKEELGDAAVLAIAADVTDESAVRDYVEQAKAINGRIDIFFNNAGIEGEIHLIPDYPLAVFEKVIAINVTAVFLGMKYVIPVMVEQGGGAIINTSSSAGKIGAAGLAPYCASKHAVIGITRVAAAEWASKNVRINTVNPGPVAGRMMSSIVSGWKDEGADLSAEQLVAGIPSGRYSTLEEIAPLVAFLASEDARHIHGAVYSVDGGQTAV